MTTSVPRPAFAHLGPGVEPGFTVVHELVAGQLRSSFLFPKELFVRVFEGRAPEDVGRAEALDRLRSASTVFADDVPLEPRILSAWFSAPTATIGMSRAGLFEGKRAAWSLIQLQLTHVLPEHFRTLRFRFRLEPAYQEHADDPALARTMGEIFVPLVVGDRRQILRFTPLETEYLVHRSDLETSPSEPSPEPPSGRSNYLPSIGLGALFSILVLLTVRTSLARRPLVATAAFASLIGLFVSLGALSGPDREVERVRFEALLRGVYGAFAEPTEEAIYDALSKVAEGPLLERLYRDVYRSLVRKEHAGALASVRRLSVLSVDVAPRSFWSPVTSLSADWEVEASVEHFGHTHDRRLRYRGRFEIAPAEDGRHRLRGATLEEQGTEANSP